MPCRSEHLSWSCLRLGFVWWWPLFCFFLFLHLFPLIYYYIIPTLKGLSCEEATLCDCNTSNRLFIDVYRPNRLLSETKLFLVTSYYPSFFSLMALAFCSMPSDKAEQPKLSLCPPHSTMLLFKQRRLCERCDKCIKIKKLYFLDCAFAGRAVCWCLHSWYILSLLDSKLTVTKHIWRESLRQVEL